MPGARRHRFMAGTIVVVLSGFGASISHAQEGKLLANCSAPQLAPADTSTSGTGSSAGHAGATANVTCEVRGSGPMTFKSAKVTVKGRSDALETSFFGFDSSKRSLAALFLVQISDPNRRGNVVLMADAVTKMADARDNNRRFAAYTFANDLNLVADFSASKADFDKQVRAIRAAALPSQLYKAALEAIGKLAREPADRKALVILGDGDSDDTSYDHDQVVKAAKDAGVTINALGYLADASDLPKFQTLQRLADETGGYRKEVRVAGVQKYVVGKQFVPEVLENGGTVKFTLREPPGPVTVTISADVGNGRVESTNYTLTMPAASATPTPTRPNDSYTPTTTPLPPSAPEAWHQRMIGWAKDHVVLAGVIGLAAASGAVGLVLLLMGGLAKPPPPLDESAVAYGWLEMLDGNASRYPLKTTNVRIGRHRDNDICLHNDSISRRHALLHFNADNRRFVITDLGGDNGVIVNKIKQQSHELTDGDLVELGEVRLRFRANVERAT